MSEEEQGFVIRDRRGRGEEAEKSATPPPKASEFKQEPPQPVPPINFPSFIYSMGTSALMLLGEAPPGQEGSGPAPNLAHAQEIIDILTMLEGKTKGNLTQDEETLLEEMLYTLRVKFVEKAGGKKA